MQFLDVWYAVAGSPPREPALMLRFLEILTWRDAVDVLAVAIIIYNLLLLIRGTRAVQMVLGLLFIGLVYYTAVLAELPTLQRILENLLIVLPFAVIVLFQQEIRRALADFGRNPLWGLAKQQKVVASFSEIVLAATTLSTRRIGALIVIERLHGLRNYIENGISLDAVRLLRPADQPLSARHAAPRRRGDHPGRPHRRRRLLPAADPQPGAVQGVRHPPPRRPRHHRGDRRRGRGGLRGDRHDLAWPSTAC